MAARETLPDLVLLDLVLPDTSGLEVLRALKQDALPKNVPVVVLAALSEPNKEELLKEGVAACVEKLDALFEGDSAPLIRTIVQVKELIVPGLRSTRDLHNSEGFPAIMGIAIASRVTVVCFVTNSEQVCDKSIRTLEFPYGCSTYQGLNVEV